MKNDYHVVHRNDLEVLGVECVWVEFKISKNHPVLIGTFNRSPDSLNYTFDLIEHSIDLAVDTGINAIVVLGDFNEDQLKPQNNKMSNIFVKYNMIQFINEPTHFTENSSSCIDLISSTDPNVIDLIHVGQPFLNVNVRYHCPIYGIFKVPKKLHTCFKRQIWLYDRGNYNLYREKLQRVDWDELINSGNSLDDLCESFSNVILQAAGETIPNKIITVRKTDPPWMNGAIRRAIRKRNRFQRQAKKSNLPVHWANFRKSRNKTVNIIRRQKELYFDNLIAKLKSRQTSARDWWKSASQLVGRNSNNSVTPL